MQVLQELIAHAGSVVSREQLIALLWPKGVVDFDTGLNAVIHKLRSALGDTSETPRYIETLPRRGYRFIGALDPDPGAAPTASPTVPVSTPSGASFGPAPPLRQEPTVLPEAGLAAPRPMPSGHEPAPPGAARQIGDTTNGEHPALGSSLPLAEPLRSHRLWWVVGAPALMLLGTVTAWYLQTHRASPRSEPVVAVLPFVDRSAPAAQDDLAEGMSEEILDLLGGVPGLRTIGRTSSFSFKGHNQDLRHIGAVLGATHLVEGSVTRSGTRIHVRSELIDASDGRPIWSDVFDREAVDLLAVQVQIASAIARQFELALNMDTARRLQPRTLEAYHLYLRGWEAVDRGDKGLREAAPDFAQALASDPGFLKAAEARALAELDEIADKLTTPQTGWPRAEQSARICLKISPGSALAHAILGLEKATFEYHWREASEELDRLLALHPRDPDALYVGAWLAFDLGRTDEALQLQDTALALDPLNPDSNQNSAYIHYLLGDLDSAERAFRKSSEISPTFGSNHLMLGKILLLRGRPQEALAEMQQEREEADLGLALAYHALGRHAESDAALTRTEAVYQVYQVPGEVNIALAHAYRGELDVAFSWLERAIAARDLNLGHGLRTEPMFAGLRGDPRYRNLLSEMNLSP